MKKGLPSNLEFEYGEAMPWFKEIGGALQIKSSKNFKDLKNELEILEKWQFSNGKWQQIK